VAPSPSPSPPPTGNPQAQRPFQLRSDPYVRPNVQGQYPNQRGVEAIPGGAASPQARLALQQRLDARRAQRAAAANPVAGRVQMPNIPQINPWENMYHGVNPAGIPSVEPQGVNALTMAPGYENAWPRLMRRYQ
jgi:hypothetical protein